MAMSERLQFLLTVDAKGAVKGFESVGKAADKDLKKAEDRLDRIGGGMQKAGAAAMAFAGVSAMALGKTVKAFQKQELAELKLQNTMSNMPKLADENIGQFLDLAKAIQKKTVAADEDTIGAMAMLGTFRLTADEIKKVTPLVVDYARKFDTDLVTAATQVGKALDGQVGALRRNGVSIDEAMYKTDRFGAVMDALGTQVGGFAESEAKTFNGQIQQMKNNLGDLSEGIGAGVVDVIGGAASSLNGLSQRLNEMDPAITRTVGKVAAVGTGLLAFAGAASFTIGTLIKMRHNFEAVGISAGKMKGAVGIAGLALVAYALHAKKAADRSRDASEAIERLGRASDAELLRALGDALAANALEAGSLAGGMAKIAEQSPGAIARLLEMEDATGELTAAMTANGGSIERAAEMIAMMRKAIEDEKVARENHTRTLEAGTEAVDENAEATDDSADAQKRHREAVKANTDKIKDLRSELLKGVDNSFDLEKATIALGNEVDKATKEIDEQRQVLANSTPGSREHEAALRAIRGAQIGVAESALTTAQAYARQQGAADGSTLSSRLQVAELQRLQAQYPASAAEIQVYIDKLNAVPGVVSTRVDVNVGAANTALNNLQNRLATMGSQAWTTQAARVMGATKSHDGSIVGGPSFAGLRPDEVPMILQKGQAVLTKEQQAATLGAGGGGNTYVTINTQADPQMVIDAIRKWERRNGGMR